MRHGCHLLREVVGAACGRLQAGVSAAVRGDVREGPTRPERPARRAGEEEGAGLCGRRPDVTQRDPELR